MNSYRSVRMFVFAVLATCMAFSGCQKNDMPSLGKVTGIVTNGGKPVIGAAVTFQPAGHGAQSSATTNERGEFTLKYVTGNNPLGAVVGKHSVTVRGGNIDPEKTAVYKAKREAAAKAAEEAIKQGREVPPMSETAYESTPTFGFKAEVTAKGPNNFTFDISSVK